MGRMVYRVNFFFLQGNFTKAERLRRVKSPVSGNLTYQALSKKFCILGIFLAPGKFPEVAHVVGDTSYADIGLAG
jgi:hypothetical protein